MIPAENPPILIEADSLEEDRYYILSWIEPSTETIAKAKDVATKHTHTYIH